jgi:tetratricopeptide (TPR) repeat protein
MAAVSSGLQEPEVITKRVAKASADIPSAKKVERKKVASKSVVVDKLPSKKADTQKIVQKKAPAKKVSLVKQAEAPATRVAPVEPAKAPAKRVALVKPVKAPALPSVGTGVAALEKASVAKASLNKASKEEISAQVNKETTSVEDLAVAKKKFESAKKRAVARAAKAVVPQDRNCKGAEVEAKRARSASSEADRLFYYRRALRLCPLEPGYHLEIGRVYAELGRKEDAEFEFHKALELDPESEEAQDELSLLMMESTNF